MPCHATINKRTIDFRDDPNSLTKHFQDTIQITNTSATTIVFKATASARTLTVKPAVSTILPNFTSDVIVSTDRVRAKPGESLQHTLTIVTAPTPLLRTRPYIPGLPFHIENEPHANNFRVNITCTALASSAAGSKAQSNNGNTPPPGNGSSSTYTAYGGFEPRPRPPPSTSTQEAHNHTTVRLPQPPNRSPSSIPPPQKLPPLSGGHDITLGSPTPIVTIPTNASGRKQSAGREQGNRGQNSGQVGMNGLPSERTEWRTSITAWTSAALEHSCNARCRPSTFVYHSLLGGMRIRAKTDKGDFMVEAFAGSSQTGLKTAKLASIVPRYIGQMLAISKNRDAILMPDYIVKSTASSTEREKFTRDYAWMQMETMGRVDELIEAGFMDLRPKALLRRLGGLRTDKMYRNLAAREGYKAQARCFAGYIGRIEKGIQALMECGVPSTIVGPQDCWKQKADDHYMFFGWIEGFVSCALSSAGGGVLSETDFMKTWSSFGEKEKMKGWRNIGKYVYGVCLLVLRLEYARKAGEDQVEREFWMKRAGMALELTNYTFANVGAQKAR